VCTGGGLCLYGEISAAPGWVGWKEGRLFGGHKRSAGKGERKGQGVKRIWEQKGGRAEWKFWDAWRSC